MEKLENKKPEKLLIAISALGNHGKTLSATRLIELLISPLIPQHFDLTLFISS